MRALYNVAMTFQRENKIYQVAVFTLLLLLIGMPVSRYTEAAEISAGFATQSIWISRTHVIAGDSVNIFTVLYNSSEDPIRGEVIFTVDNSSIGTKEFTLKAGETQTFALPWVAKAGDHSISARIENTLVADTNTRTSLLNHATGNITVSVEAPPPPSPSVQVLNSVATAVLAGVASSTPAVKSALTSLYETTESMRKQAKSALEQQITGGALTSDMTPSGTSVTDAQSNMASTSFSATQPDTSILSNAGRYAALAGLTVVNSRTFFYISLALVLLLLIQLLRVFMRERRRG